LPCSQIEKLVGRVEKARSDINVEFEITPGSNCVTASFETTKYGFAPYCVSSFELEPGDILLVDAENADDLPDRPMQRELAQLLTNRNFCLQLTIFVLAFRPLGLGGGISDVQREASRSKSRSQAAVYDRILGKYLTISMKGSRLGEQHSYEL
jgi:hypothetical protein